MDSVLARGRSVTKAEKYGRKPGTHMLLEAGEQAEIRETIVENAGRFWDTWQTVDAGLNKATHPEAVS